MASLFVNVKQNKEEIIDNNLIKQMSSSIKIKDCGKVETVLSEGEQIKITEFKYIGNSLLISAVHKEAEILLIASYWLRKLLEDKNILQINNSYIIVVAGPMKTTPTKSKCRTFFM